MKTLAYQSRAHKKSFASPLKQAPFKKQRRNFQSEDICCWKDTSQVVQNYKSL